MTQRQTTLANGLKIITTHMADARSVTANIIVATGSRQEDFQHNGGVSHFLEHLLFKGSSKYPSAQAIAEAVDAVGGYNNAYTSDELTSFYIKVPAAHGELALDILADMVQNPLLDATEIDRERDVVIEEMNVYHDDPARFIWAMPPQLLYPDHSLGYPTLGTEKVIAAIPQADIARYQSSHYRPGNMVVAVAGAVDHDAVVRQLEKTLGTLEDQAQAARVAVPERASHDLAITQEKATAQAHLIIASRAYSYTDDDDMAAKVASAILGRGMSSRLFMNVRERQGLAYTVFCETSNNTDTGMFATYAGVNLEKANQAVTSICHELARMRQDLVAPAELEKAKQQLRAGFEMSLESNGSVAERIGTMLALTGRVESAEEVVAQINAVTAADVQRVCGQMFDPAGLRFAMIAPKPEATAEHFKELVTKGE